MTEQSPAHDARIALARQMYADGKLVRQILVAAKVSERTLYTWLDGLPQADGTTQLRPIPRRKDAVGERKPVTPASTGRVGDASQLRQRRKRRTKESRRAAMVARLWRTAERQVHEIELRLGDAQAQAPERERDARALAILVKTLRELVAFDEAASPTTSDDEPPTDIDEFRRALARRMDAIVARREADGDDGDVAR